MKNDNLREQRNNPRRDPFCRQLTRCLQQSTALKEKKKKRKVWRGDELGILQRRDLRAVITDYAVYLACILNKTTIKTHLLRQPQKCELHTQYRMITRNQSQLRGGEIMALWLYKNMSLSFSGAGSGGGDMMQRRKEMEQVGILQSGLTWGTYLGKFKLFSLKHLDIIYI